MQGSFGSLFFLRHPYANSADRRRAQGILYLLTSVRLIWIAWLITTGIPNLLSGEQILMDVLLMMLVPIPVVLTNIAVQNGRLSVASNAIVVISLFFMIVILNRTTLQSANFIVAALPIVTAGLLLNKRSFWFALIAIVLSLGWLLLDEFGTFDAISQANLVSGIVIAAFLTSLFLAFSGQKGMAHVDESQIKRMEQVSRFRADISRDSEMEIFRQVLELLRSGLGFYFAQLFLAESDGQLVQRVRRGFNDAEIIDVSLLNEMNSLNRAARSQGKILVSSADPAVQREHLMAFSAYGIVVPMIADGHTIGVIDVQSNAAPFTEEDDIALTALADQVATLIRDVRAMRSLRENLADQEQALSRLRARVHDFGATEREGISSVWDAYLEQRGKQALGFDLNDGQLIEREDLPESIRDGLRQGDVVLKEEADAQLMIVPIVLRGEMLGAMSFQLPLGHAVSQRRIEMARSVAQRLAVALENQRLFEQSRLQALRERKASEIGSLLLSATDIDQVLDLAANSFNEALGAIHTTIHLQPETVHSPQEAARRTATRKLQDPSVYASRSEGADS